MGFLLSDEITFFYTCVFCIKNEQKRSYPDSGSGIHLHLVNIRQLEDVQNIDRFPFGVEKTIILCETVTNLSTMLVAI